ncbi:MAG TPA: sugar ABC transporter ATP-binding protein [Chitinophagaceae bacterium]|nr:sugar ABC transporter ATP-binding protein [Chitinophagaceae bacterium]
MALHLQNISKSFPGVRALHNVTLDVLTGQIHAVCGENGAGKSTLMNIVAGNISADEGRIVIDEQEVIIRNPRDAFNLGISIVYQHLSLVDSLSVAENIFANQHPLNAFGIIQYGQLYQNTSAILQELDLEHIHCKTLVANLSPAQKQMVEIAKAVSKKPSILILDEPTASLTEKESKILFNILHRLKQQGVSIIYISHRLHEIFLLADQISILKDGEHQGTFLKSNISKEELIRRMVGREIKSLKIGSHVQEEISLSVKNLSGKKFNDISFHLHRGEILGVAGLIGAGRTEIARAIFGIDKINSGEVVVRNKLLHFTHPSEAIQNGLAYVPEERKNLGLFLEMSIKDNIIVAQLVKAKDVFYDSKKSDRIATTSKKKLRIITPHVHQKVIHLSGGNQQKVVLAKWLLTEPDILIVDEPTHGIDVGSRYEIYEILQSLAADGKSIIIISSDLPEILGLCDRIIVIKKGLLSGEISRAEATEEKIIAMAAN